MQTLASQYSSWVTVTPSDTTLISCRAIYVGGGAGNLSVNPGATGGTTVVFTAPSVAAASGVILPISLDQGRIMAATTSTNVVALA